MAYGFRKVKITFTLFFFLFSSFVFPQFSFAAPGAPLPGPAFDPSQVGVAAAVKGIVKISKTSAVGRDVQSGEPIFLGDNIATNADSNLQILLLDQTVFTIGPNSAIVIDKFVYDPDTNDGALNAKVVKGVFRFVTGKIGHKDPKKVNIDLPSGTIGIRGTMVAGKVEGKHSLVVLLGPGEQNNTSSRRGAIIVSDKGTSEFVGRAGFGTELDGQNPPKQPFLVPTEKVHEINTRIGDINDSNGEDQNQNQNQNKGNHNQNGPGSNPKGEPRDGGNESATKQAGQDRAKAGLEIKQTLRNNRIFTKLDRESDRASQDSKQDEFRGGGSDNFTKYGQLLKLPSGALRFSQSNIALLKSDGTNVGTYHLEFIIDPSRGVMGGGVSQLDGNINSDNFDIPLPEKRFEKDDEIANYRRLFTHSTNPSDVPSGVTVEINVTPLNNSSGIARSLLHGVTVTQSVITAVGGGEAPDAGSGRAN